eukprot:gene16553-30269_t
MIRHIVLLKFKEGADKAAVSAAISAALNALPAAIPEIKSYTCGPDAGLDPARNHDYALVGDFENAEAYEVYAKHPLHQAAIVEHIKPNLAAGGRVAVQYEI